MGHIVVGMDTSPGAAAALRWAVREADSRGWQVTAVLAWMYPGREHLPHSGSFYPAYGDDEALIALDAAVETAVGDDAARGVKRTAVRDLAASALLTASEGADLLVVGARGLGGFRALLLGSVGEQCLHHATCPVAVVRSADGPAPERIAGAGELTRIVVGLDGSENARAALRWALDAGRAHDATVEVIHAQRPLALGVGYEAILPLDPPVDDSGARQMLEEALDGEDTSGLAVPVERMVLTGPAAQVVLEAAKGADMVVLGSRGLGGFKGLLLGSVSHQVARHAPCPVVVVPGVSPG